MSHWWLLKVVNYSIIHPSIGEIHILTRRMLNILHVLSNQLIHLQDVRIAITKYLVSVDLTFRTLRPSDQFAESFKSAPQSWLQVQRLLIAFDCHFLFELLLQYEAKQVVASSAIWDIHVLVEVQMVVLEQITGISTVLWKTSSCKRLLSIIKSIEFYAGNCEFIPVLGWLAIFQNIICFIRFVFAYICGKDRIMKREF